MQHWKKWNTEKLGEGKGTLEKPGDKASMVVEPLSYQPKGCDRVQIPPIPGLFHHLLVCSSYYHKSLIVEALHGIFRKQKPLIWWLACGHFHDVIIHLRGKVKTSAARKQLSMETESSQEDDDKTQTANETIKVYNIMSRDCKHSWKDSFAFPPNWKQTG